MHEGSSNPTDNCPKILYTDFSDKMVYADSADQYQTGQGVHCLPVHQDFVIQMHKNNNTI